MEVGFNTLQKNILLFVLRIEIKDYLCQTNEIKYIKMKQATNKQINEYIKEGNAFEVSENVYLEQTTQYRTKFTLNQLKEFYYNEYLKN
tara:strand:- start:249 stop:515 length:267 start_codon:yes stop_codon:yes gene_type:complete